MPISPEIALGGKPVQVDTTHLVNLIAQGQQRRMQQESHAQQMQIGQQHIAAGELAGREAQLKMRDDQIGTEAYQKAQGHPGDTIKLMVAGGARPQAVQVSEKHFADIAEQKAKTGKDQLEVEKYRNEQMLGQIGQAETMIQQNPEAFAQQWPQMFEAAKQIDPETAKHFDPSTPPTLQQIQAAKLPHLTLAQVIKQNEENRAAASAKQASLMGPEQLKEIQAKVKSAESDAAIKQFELDAAKATPEQQQAKVAAAIDPTKYPEIFKRTLATVTGAVTHAEKQAALAKGSAEVGEREKETDPNIRNARVATAVATEKALSPLKIAEAVQTEIAKAKASGDAFGSIVDPVERHRAEAEYDAHSKEFLDKVGEARRLKDLINAAQHGNKAAPGLIPIEELRSYVNRINTQELKAVGPGAGDLVDQIKGKISKLTSGQPIPPDLLKDIGAIADLNEKAADRTYNFKLQIIRQKGAKVQAIKPDDIFKSDAAATPIRARDAQGNLHEAPAGTPLPAGWKEEKKQ